MNTIQDYVFNDNNKINFSPDNNGENYALANFTIAETGFNLYFLKC